MVSVEDVVTAVVLLWLSGSLGYVGVWVSSDYQCIMNSTLASFLFSGGNSLLT